MPTIYNAIKYNQAKYSQGNPYHKQGRLYYGSCIAGIEVRGQIGKKWIYRRRPGNGYYDSKIGTIYQDRYAYFVPGSINNAESEPWRITFRAAVDYWRNILTDSQKKEYTKKGSRTGNIPGYNQFIREAMKGEFHMWVDRGDLATYDFDKNDFTIDGNWHDLDLSGIIPKTARLLLLRGQVKGASADWRIQCKKYGNIHDINACCMETLRANVSRCRMGTVQVDGNRKISYNVDNQSWTTLKLFIRGWWT